VVSEERTERPNPAVDSSWHPAAVAPLDHRDRRPAVLGDCLHVLASRDEIRDERVASGVELPDADLDAAEHRVPALPRPPLGRDRVAFRVPEHVGRLVELDRYGHLAKDLEELREELDRSARGSRLRRPLLARASADPDRRRTGLEVEIAVAKRRGLARPAAGEELECNERVPEGSSRLERLEDLIALVDREGIGVVRATR